MKVKCGVCQYWELMYGRVRDKGECRKNTPDMTPTGRSCWPLTVDSDFCHAGIEKNKNLNEVEMEQIINTKINEG